MKRPSYATVSYSLLALALFGFVVEGLRKKIPDPPSNRLQYEGSEFLLQGSRSEVDWRPLESSAFAEARRTGRPILLLIGAPWSKIARDADAQIFSDRDVVSFLNRYMVCIRIDAQTEPRWMAAFLPLRRPVVPMNAGFQVWFLTPEGQVFDNAGEIGTVLPIDPDAFGDILVRAREALRAIRAGGSSAPVPGSNQAADRLRLIESSFPAAYDAGKLASEVSQSITAGLGGQLRYGRVKPIPGVLQYLLLTGRAAEFRKIADDLLRSPIVDWLDGGFYRAYGPFGSRILEFDKVSTTNSELMAVFAKASVMLKEPVYERIAKNCFDNLAEDYIQNGIVAGCQVGDEGAQGRSARSSFTPRRLRELLTPEEQLLAAERMNLRADRNRFMSVWLVDPADQNQPPISAILEKLRSARKGNATFAGHRQLDVHGFVVARLLECARLWDETDRLLIVDELFQRLDWFLAGDDVRHTLEENVPSEPYLGDYLAYSDAALHHYLAFGRSSVLRKGMQVLLRARFLFETGTPGVWQMTYQEKAPLQPKDVDVPEVLDLVRESCSAQAIRLCNSYGRILRNAELLQAAQSSVTQYSVPLSQVGIDGAGMFCSAAKVLDDTHAIVVGPGSAKIAGRLYRAAPHRLTAPAIGEVETAFRGKAAGIYVIRAGTVGQLSNEEQAISILASPLPGH